MFRSSKKRESSSIITTTTTTPPPTNNCLFGTNDSIRSSISRSSRSRSNSIRSTESSSTFHTGPSLRSSLSDGSSDESDSSSSSINSNNYNNSGIGSDHYNSMTSCLPPVIMTRSIPDGDDNKYGCKNYTSMWKKLCGCYSDRTPRPLPPINRRGSSSGSSVSSTTSGNNSTNSIFQQRFLLFISVIAFIRVSNTFYMYKVSLDDLIQQGYEPSSMSGSTRHLSSKMMMYYQEGNYPFADMLFPLPAVNQLFGNVKKSSKKITYNQLLDEYSIPLLIVPQYDIAVTMEQNGFDPWLLINDDERHTRIHTLQDTYKTQRQQRTRPPTISGDDSSNTWTVVETFTTSSTERQTVGSETMIDIANATDQYNWNDLCTRANLVKTSRVIVTNALSVSIGAPITLLLSNQCGIKNIMIVDSMFPNTKRRRSIMMDTYRTLFRNILTLQFTNPTNTAGFGKSGSEVSTDWIEKFEPTHILHLEDLDHVLDSETLWNEYMSTKGQQLLHLQNSILSIQQIMNYIHHKEKTNPVNVLHVSMSSVLSDPTMSNTDDDESTTMNGVAHLHKTSVTHDINTMMADYLHTMQQFRTSVIDESNILQMHHLKLPNVYGPIINGNLHDRTKMAFKNGNSLYLDDAMASIFKAMHISHDKHRLIMSIPFEQVHASNTIWRQELTHAYEIAIEYPFGGIEPEHYLSKITNVDVSKYQNAMTWVNDLYGVYKAKLPCASSCVDSTDTTMCDTSVWDTIYPVSQSITETCTNVMYYVNLDVTLENLTGPIDAVTATKSQNDLCRIAFLSNSSPLVIEALRQERLVGTKDSENPAYNGHLIINGWTIVWVDAATTKVSESDLSLIRIDPQRFFVPTVQKAIYVESDEIMSLSTEEVIDQLISQSVHEEHADKYYTTELREGFEDLYRTIEHPPSNARAVTFVASELPDSIRPNNPAQFIELLSQRPGVTNVKGRHLNYYKQMNHYVQVDMNRPVEDSDGSSPFIWISRDYFIHNLQGDPGHQLRCEWYDAHMYWGTTDGIVAKSEELTFAYIVAKQRILGDIGYPLIDDSTWFPQLNPYTKEPIYITGTESKKMNDDGDTITIGTEAFVRIMRGASSPPVEEEEEESTSVDESK